jgi:hypothetical protein
VALGHVAALERLVEAFLGRIFRAVGVVAVFGHGAPVS